MRIEKWQYLKRTKKKEETKKVSTQEDNELKDEISKAYDEIMSGNKEEKAEEQPQQEPKKTT